MRLIWKCIAVGTLLSSFAFADTRTWTEAGSGRELEATLISVQDEQVTLRREKDGKRFALALSKLSEADQTYVAQWQAEKSGKKSLTQVKADRFKDLRWRNREQIPVTGTSRKKYDGIDDAILDFMVAKGIGAVTAAISLDGKILYERAFGFQDAKLQEPLAVETSMRLASISKPITAAAVKTAIRDGKLRLEDKIFDVLKLGDQAPRDLDDRWKQITIEHLLKHEGGFDRDASGDPVFKLPTIADDENIRLEKITLDPMIAWMLEKPLDFDPGSKDSYSNFGYNLLAKAVETVSEQSFEMYLNETIADEAKMTTLTVGKTELKERALGEIWYHFHPEYDDKPRVMPFRIEPSYGAGGLVCSAADLCRFLETYWISGEPKQGGNYHYRFHGSMPGTTTISAQRKDRVCYAVLCNRRAKQPEDWNKELAAVVDAALDEVDW